MLRDMYVYELYETKQVSGTFDLPLLFCNCNGTGVNFQVQLGSPPRKSKIDTYFLTHGQMITKYDQRDAVDDYSSAT